MLSSPLRFHALPLHSMDGHTAAARFSPFFASSAELFGALALSVARLWRALARGGFLRPCLLEALSVAQNDFWVACSAAMLREPNFNPKQTYNGPMDGFTVTGILGKPDTKSFKLKVTIPNSTKKEFRVDYLDHRDDKKHIVEAAIRTYEESPEFRASGNDNKAVRDSFNDFIKRLYNRLLSPFAFVLSYLLASTFALLCFALQSPSRSAGCRATTSSATSSSATTTSATSATSSATGSACASTSRPRSCATPAAPAAPAAQRPDRRLCAASATATAPQQHHSQARSPRLFSAARAAGSEGPEACSSDQAAEAPQALLHAHLRHRHRRRHNIAQRHHAARQQNRSQRQPLRNLQAALERGPHLRRSKPSPARAAAGARDSLRQRRHQTRSTEGPSSLQAPKHAVPLRASPSPSPSPLSRRRPARPRGLQTRSVASTRVGGGPFRPHTAPDLRRRSRSRFKRLRLRLRLRLRSRRRGPCRPSRATAEV